jgi:hypothetical protein
MLQDAFPNMKTGKVVNWQTILEAIHRRSLWVDQHVVDCLQTEASSVSTARFGLSQNVCYKPLYAHTHTLDNES